MGGWDIRLKAGLYPESMGNASSLSRKTEVEERLFEAAKRKLHSGRCPEALLHPSSLTLSLL